MDKPQRPPPPIAPKPKLTPQLARKLKPNTETIIANETEKPTIANETETPTIANEIEKPTIVSETEKPTIASGTEKPSIPDPAVDKTEEHNSSDTASVDKSSLSSSTGKSRPTSSSGSSVTSFVAADTPCAPSPPSPLAPYSGFPGAVSTQRVSSCSLGSSSLGSSSVPTSSDNDTTRSSAELEYDPLIRTSISEESITKVNSNITCADVVALSHDHEVPPKFSDDKTANESLIPPPRTRKLLKSKKQNSVNNNNDNNNVDIRLREKVGSKSDRSSRPPRGTVMLALADLLASTGEPEISLKRMSRRPVPRPRSKSFSAAVLTEPTPNTLVIKLDRSAVSPIPKPRNSLILQGTEKLVDDKDKVSDTSLCQTGPTITVGHVVDKSNVSDEKSSGERDSKNCDTDNHYGHVWSHLSPVPSAIPDTSCSKLAISESKSNALSRNNTSPLPNPKIRVRRPSAPPPAPPPDIPPASSSNSDTQIIKKRVPSRPAPPIPVNKSGVAIVCNTAVNQNVEVNSQTSAPNSAESVHTEVEENMYHEADDSDVDLHNKPDHSDCKHEPNPRNVSLSPSSLVLTGNQSSDDTESGGSQEYMIPISKMEGWPEEDAPTPNAATAVTFDFSEKSATLQSITSNVYEDMDSSSDEGAFGSHLGVPREDVYSDYLDETFENEDSVKAGSSSESEAESEEAAETKLAKQQTKLYNVAQEIVTSEKEFLDKLVLLNIDFRKYISDTSEEQGETIIPATCMNKILNHLPQLTNVNDELLKDLEQRLENWDENSKIADVFVKKGPFLRMYTTYISNFQTMTNELDQAIKDYPVFADTLKAFEKSERCRNLQLRHYMLKPIQRIPQYRLLLSAYQKYLPDDSLDKEDTQAALKIVSEVADHANEAMKQNDSLQTLLDLQSLLVGEFRVIEPSRELVKRGDVHKQSRKVLQSRTLFLFNDYLVITTAQPNGCYKINYDLPLQHVQVNKPSREEFHKEFTIISKKKSFTSVTSTVKERDEWVAILEATIHERERKIGTYMRGLIGATGSREYVLGEVAPVWIPDNRVSMCMKCSRYFTTFNRRHHCRACGQVMCGACSAFKAPLKYEDHRPMRVCEGCYDKLYTESRSSRKSRRGFSTKARSTVKGSPRVKPTVLQEVHATDEGEVSGYLNVQVKKRQWEQYWFVLKDKVLYKYLACEDTAAIESKPLLGYKVAAVGTSYEGLDKNILFRLHHPSMDIIEPVLFKTETSHAAARWIEKMTESTTA